MKPFRKVADERQELEMMRTERGAFWVMLLALPAAILVQLFALDFDPAHVAGEFAVLAAGSVWASAGYFRRGSWGCFTRPGFKAYLIYSLAAGFVFGLAAPLARYFRHGAPLLDCLGVFFKNFSICFALAFAACWALGAAIKRRQERLGREYADDGPEEG